MADTPNLPRLPDVAADLRKSVEAHAAAVDASKRAGADVQAAKLTPPEAEQGT